MPAWQVEPIHAPPGITLSEWAVFEVPLHGPRRPWTRHLAGWSCDDGQGEVSSPLRAFDPATATCVTCSGKVYRLDGVPGLCEEGQYTLDLWRRVHAMKELRDVTADVFIAIQDALVKRMH